eukprot:4715498-Prymnesium_polylepis.2
MRSRVMLKGKVKIQNRSSKTRSSKTVQRLVSGFRGGLSKQGSEYFSKALQWTTAEQTLGDKAPPNLRRSKVFLSADSMTMEDYMVREERFSQAVHSTAARTFARPEILPSDMISLPS